MVLRAAAPLQPYDPSLARLFRAAVETAPGHTFLAERAVNPGASSPTRRRAPSSIPSPRR